MPYFSLFPKWDVYVMTAVSCCINTSLKKCNSISTLELASRFFSKIKLNISIYIYKTNIVLLVIYKISLKPHCLIFVFIQHPFNQGKQLIYRLLSYHQKHHPLFKTLFPTVSVHRMEIMTVSVGLLHTNEILVMKYTYKGALVLV